MTDEEVLAEFRAADALLEGHFILSSGLRSSRYLQCARVLMDPRRGARLAAALAAVLPPGLERVFFSDNGSTAVEVGVKVALQAWHNQGRPRRLVAALEGAYHGDTFGAMSVGGRGVFLPVFHRRPRAVGRLWQHQPHSSRRRVR